MFIHFNSTYLLLHYRHIARAIIVFHNFSANYNFAIWFDSAESKKAIYSSDFHFIYRFHCSSDWDKRINQTVFHNFNRPFSHRRQCNVREVSWSREIYFIFFLFSVTLTIRKRIWTKIDFGSKALRKIYQQNETEALARDWAKAKRVFRVSFDIYCLALEVSVR